VKRAKIARLVELAMPVHQQSACSLLGLRQLPSDAVRCMKL
jgi:hypothetical protein